jgi:multimeric flavodoxin WrbA
MMDLPKTLLVAFYSSSGRTEKMALRIAEGAAAVGVNAVLRKIGDCTQRDLAGADDTVVGSPTQYSNMAWQVKKLLDETILAFYNEGHSLRNKVCGCFTSTGACADGKECLRMLELAFGGALKMKMVSGLILESKDVDAGNLTECSGFGQKIAQELT